MRRLLYAGLLVLSGGCVTPSIPLPPPDLAALSFVSGPTPGTLELEGKPSAINASSRFAAFNEQRHVGVLVDTAVDGSFASEPFAGGAGDLVELWFEAGGKRSQIATCTVVLDTSLNSTLCH